MKKCIECGKKGFFLKLNNEGLCNECAEKKMIQIREKQKNEIIGESKIKIIVESFNLITNSNNSKTVYSRCKLISDIIDKLNFNDRKFIESELKKHHGLKLSKIEEYIISILVGTSCGRDSIQCRNEIIEQEYSEHPYDKNGEILPTNTNDMTSDELIRHYERKFTVLSSNPKMIGEYYFEYAAYLNLVRKKETYSIKEIEEKFETGLKIVVAYLSSLSEKNRPLVSNTLNYYFTFSKKNKNYDKMIEICNIGIKYKLQNSSGKGYAIIKEELIAKSKGKSHAI